MEHFFKAYVCLGHISQSFTQNYQHNLSIDEIYNLQYLEIVVWFRKECQSLAQIYRCKLRIKSWDGFPHLPSQVFTYQDGYFGAVFQ